VFILGLRDAFFVKLRREDLRFILRRKDMVFYSDFLAEIRLDFALFFAVFGVFL